MCEMPEQIYKPVRIDTKITIVKANLRPGFTQAWDALEEEYAALEGLLSARKKRAASARISRPDGGKQKRYFAFGVLVTQRKAFAIIC